MELTCDNLQIFYVILYLEKNIRRYIYTKDEKLSKIFLLPIVNIFMTRQRIIMNKSYMHTHTHT